jgi:NhaP-type Na+/H+ or K+/H+ antiporter
MVPVINILFGISIILFLGFFAELLFKKFRIPDVLFLIVIGFIIGPVCLKLVLPEQIDNYMTIFTTFALLFLLYDGAFNISLKSILKGAIKSLKVTLFNFIISVIAVSGIMIAFGFTPLISLLVGFILGGISSAFVIPLLKQMGVEEETYSILTLESAVTDVLCIVSALTVLEIITLNSFNFQTMISNIASLFAIAGVIGIVAGVLWIVIVTKIFKENKSYMVTIAYLIFVYVITEFLNGNGAIAALFFGLVLKNSKEIIEIFQGIINKKPENDKDKTNHIKKHINGIGVTTENEEFFYSQISFFLKTFFFVYIGILFNISNYYVMFIGGIIAVALMVTRKLTVFIIKDFDKNNKQIITSIFARGLAAAAIAQIVVIQNIDGAETISNIVINVIVFSIILSSISIFFLKKSINKQEEAYIQ